jgi:hypothetical protein
MRLQTLPQPPVYQSDQQAFNRAVTDWMARVKGIIDIASCINDTPAQTAMLATNYTSTQTVDGTMTGTDVTNALATLIDTLTKKGVLSPTVSRENNV